MEGGRKTMLGSLSMVIRGHWGKGLRMARAKPPGRLETDYCESRSGLCEIIDPNLSVVKQEFEETEISAGTSVSDYR